MGAHVPPHPALSLFLSPDAGAHHLKLLSKGRILVDVFLVFPRKFLQAAFEGCHHAGDVAKVFLRDFLTDRLERLRAAFSGGFGKVFLLFFLFCSDVACQQFAAKKTKPGDSNELSNL